MSQQKQDLTISVTNYVHEILGTLPCLLTCAWDTYCKYYIYALTGWCKIDRSDFAEKFWAQYWTSWAYKGVAYKMSVFVVRRHVEWEILTGSFYWNNTTQNMRHICSQKMQHKIPCHITYPLCSQVLVTTHFFIRIK